MKKNDIVSIHNNRLVIHFKASGVKRILSTIPLISELCIFQRREKTIICVRGNKEEFEIDSFSNEENALEAYNQICVTLTKHHKSLRFVAIVKSLLLWGVFPTLIFLGFLALNAALNLPKSTPFIPNQKTAQFLPGTEHNRQPAQQTPVTPAALSATLKKALTEGIYTINVSSKDEAPTLYIFSDPACPACQKFETPILELKKHFTIHVFPVSKIGGVKSLNHAASILCVQPDNRVDAWNALMETKKTDYTPCEQGVLATNINNQFFTRTSLKGTPTIIHENGQIMPYNLLNDPEKMIEWANEQKSL